jgi:hypothetical protein
MGPVVSRHCGGQQRRPALCLTGPRPGGCVPHRSFTLLLRQQGDGVLSPPSGQTAPRGAPAGRQRCCPSRQRWPTGLGPSALVRGRGASTGPPSRVTTRSECPVLAARVQGWSRPQESEIPSLLAFLLNVTRQPTSLRRARPVLTRPLHQRSPRAGPVRSRRPQTRSEKRPGDLSCAGRSCADRACSL